MGSDRYLYAVEYESGAERKRVEYLFDNWVDGTVDRPEGLVRVAEGAAHDELYKQLINKVPAERVSAYELESADTSVEPMTVRVSQTIAAPVEAIESFIQYMFSKKRLDYSRQNTTNMRCILRRDAPLCRTRSPRLRVT